MIYFVQAEGVGHIKIGYTDGESADSRLATLQTGSPVPLRILHTMPGTMEDEKNLHRRFASAGVGGEWFKAVPDLLAMIPAAERKACEGVDVAERSVSIRVLTVGRKQFTKSLLAQLPQYTAFDWHAVVDDISCQGDDEPGQLRFPSTLFSKQGAREAVDQYDFAELVAPRVLWGWVHADPQPPNYRPKRWVIFVHRDRLYRQIDHMHFGDFADAVMWDARYQPIVEALFNAKRSIRGLRDEDQLFIGV
jgi:hypothetical protein